MTEQKYRKIKEIFEGNKGYAQTKEIVEQGIHTSYLYKLVEDDLISRIKRGLYHWNDYDINNHKELIEVSKIVPNGIICLSSALSYYDMTTYNPWEYYIAIHRDHYKPKLPDYPPISIFYFSDNQFNIGINEINIEGTKIKIYDLEKTICDCVRYRNKIGIDVVKEALNEYTKKRCNNINRLLDYARDTGVYTIIKRYLEVLI